MAAEDNPVSQAFFKNLEVQLGEGSKILFWKDLWLLDKPLVVVFPELFTISAQKKEMISNMGWCEGMAWRWTLSWRRALTTEEQQKLVKLQDLLVNHHPIRNEKDRAQWGMNGKSSVKDLLVKANKISKERAAVDTLVCTVWRKIGPPKVELMLWLALFERLNTKSMLVKKRILQSQDNFCSFCAQQEEDIDHLLLNCQVSWNIWCHIAADFGIQVIRHQRFRHFYEWWMSKTFYNRTRKKLFILAFFATAWSLWLKRNKVLFEQHEMDIQAVLHILRWRIAWRSKAWKEKAHYNADQLAANFRNISLMLP